MTRVNRFTEIYKRCNNGDNHEKYELIKSGGIKIPRYIDAELTNCCNFRCRFCPTGTNSMQRPRGYMPDEVVDALVSNIEKYKIPGVRFSRWGEPTLHPDYIKIIKKIKSVCNGGGGYDTAVHLNTNGSLMDAEAMQALIDMQLDSIKFSFQGADEDSYNEMRDGGDYKHLVDTLRLMHELRGDRPYPYIQVSTTLTGESAHQVENFKRDIENYCDYYNIGYTKLTHLNVDSMNVSEAEKEKIKKIQEHEKINHVYREICPEAFDKLSVNFNGDVTLCCSDYDNFMIIGNILDNSLEEIFTSKAADFYRKIIAAGEYGRIKCCASCYETVPLQK